MVNWRRHRLYPTKANSNTSQVSMTHCPRKYANKSKKETVIRHLLKNRNPQISLITSYNHLHRHTRENFLQHDQFQSPQTQTHKTTKHDHIRHKRIVFTPWSLFAVQQQWDRTVIKIVLKCTSKTFISWINLKKGTNPYKWTSLKSSNLFLPQFAPAGFCLYTFAP